jgi:hypothetical protein
MHGSGSGVLYYTSNTVYVYYAFIKLLFFLHAIATIISVWAIAPVLSKFSHIKTPILLL